MSLVIQGMRSDGTSDLLDTYTGTVDAVRQIDLENNYEYFLLVPTWTAASSLSVGVGFTCYGEGPVAAGNTTDIEADGSLPIPVNIVGGAPNVSVSIAAIGYVGNTAPNWAMLIAGQEPLSGDLIPLQVDTHGRLVISGVDGGSY